MTKRVKPIARRSPAPSEGYRKPAPEMVDPRWLLKAGAVMLLVCLTCAYAAICVLFAKTQWQLVLHPSRRVAHTVAEYGLQAQNIRFAVDATGEPQLQGWWIPGDQGSDPTVLMLPGGDGSASDWLARAATLHAAHLNVLLFDYRGYGASGARHPTESTMEADSDHALEYLLQTRGVPAGSVLVYGAGAGGSLATRLCAEHKELPGLILEAADGDFAARTAADPRAKLVPFQLLFHEQFPLAERLRGLATPKLLISYTRDAAPAKMASAGDPKILLEISSAADEKDISETLRRFLDSYVTHPVGVLTPNGG